MHGLLLKISHSAVHRSSLHWPYSFSCQNLREQIIREKKNKAKYWTRRSNPIQNIGCKVESMLLRGEKPQVMTGSNIIEASLHQMVFQKTGKETDRGTVSTRRHAPTYTCTSTVVRTSSCLPQALKQTTTTPAKRTSLTFSLTLSQTQFYHWP